MFECIINFNYIINFNDIIICFNENKLFKYQDTCANSLEKETWNGFESTLQLKRDLQNPTCLSLDFILHTQPFGRPVVEAEPPLLFIKKMAQPKPHITKTSRIRIKTNTIKIKTVKSVLKSQILFVFTPSLQVSWVITCFYHPRNGSKLLLFKYDYKTPKILNI